MKYYKCKKVKGFKFEKFLKKGSGEEGFSKIIEHIKYYVK